MYIGRHREASLLGERGEGGIHLPENYAGNAFSTERERNEQEEVHATESCAAQSEEDTACLCEEKEGDSGGLLPKIDRLFSSDALLILLAILLSGSDEGGELAVILLLLLLF